MMTTLRLAIVAALGAALSLVCAGSAGAADFPSYTWSSRPSPVVLYPMHRHVTLEPYSYCWNGPRHAPGGSIASCADGTPPRGADVPRTRHQRPIRFWFGRRGWTFTGEMTQVPHGCIVIRQPAHIRRVAPKQFLIARPRIPGTYRVELSGKGPEGHVSVVFKWVYGGRTVIPLGGPAAPPSHC